MSENQVKNTDAPVEPVAAPVKKKSGFKFSGLDWIVIAMMAGGLFLLAWNTGYIRTWTGGGVSTESAQTTQSSVAYVDMAAIVNAATKQYLEKSKDTNDAPEISGKEFSKKLAAVFDEYRESGVMVIDSKVIVVAPAGLDITNTVAAKLGLKLAD